MDRIRGDQPGRLTACSRHLLGDRLSKASRINISLTFSPSRSPMRCESQDQIPNEPLAR